MTRAALLLFALLAALFAGSVLGWWGRRTREAVRLPPQHGRPAALEAALRAWETGDRGGVSAALRGALLETAEDRAEAALLRALVADDVTALRRIARDHAETPAGARALWEFATRAPPGAARDAARAAFEARWPHAWVLGPPPEDGR